MSAADDEEARRAERSRAVALFRYTLIRDAADASVGSPRERGKMVRARRRRASRAVRRPGTGVAVQCGPVDPGLAERRVRGFAAVGAPGHPGQRRACWRWRRRSKGRTRTAPRRRSPGSWASRRVGAVGADAAAAVRPAGVGRPPDRRPRCSAGSRRRGRTSSGSATHCTARYRRPQDLPVRVPRRPFTAGRRVPVRVRRGHGAPGRGAAPGFGRRGIPERVCR